MTRNSSESGGPHRAIQSGDAREIRSLAFLTAAVGAALLWFYCLDPAVSGGFWVCPFHRLTGLECPGCGGQRALHELLRGHFAAALRLNAFAVLLFMPLAGYAYLAYALRVLGIARLPGLPVRGWPAAALLAAVLLFGVLRNL